MTREEVDEAMTNDFLINKQVLTLIPLQVQDVRVHPNPEFFETMLARTYVGYGASSLGVDTAFSNPQPAQYLVNRTLLVHSYNSYSNARCNVESLRYCQLV